MKNYIMNKIISMAFLCAAAMSFTACVNEEDDLFDKSAAERLNEASELYSKRLCASPNGWAVQLYPTKEDKAPYGNGYLLLFRFHENKSVDASMYNAISNNTYMSASSTWDVITDNGPVLSFNTYNSVVHTFSDPEDVPSTGSDLDPNDETGTGIGGDYEFIIVDAPEDASYMMLKGKKRGTYNLLTPVEEGVDYEAYLTDVRNFQNSTFPSDAPTFDVLHAGDVLYKMADANDGIPNIFEYDKDQIINESFNPFLITKLGDDYYLRFRDSKTYGDYTVQEFKYDKEKDIFVSTDNAECYISGDDPLRFFKQTIHADKYPYYFQWTAATESSAAYANMMTNLESQMTNVKYTLGNLQLKPGENNSMVFKVFYKYNRRNYSADFNFSYTESENGLTLTYNGTSSTGSALLTAFPALQTLIDAMSGNVSVAAGKSAFNLRTIRLISDANPEVWYNIEMKS